MNIVIQTPGMAPDRDLIDFIRRRVVFALSRHERHIKRVLIRAAELDDPGHGRDQSCLVENSTAGNPDVIVENIESNLFLAIHRAIDRAGWTLARKLQRRRRMAPIRLPAARQTYDSRQPVRAA